jgi:hypothetical protein
MSKKKLLIRVFREIGKCFLLLGKGIERSLRSWYTSYLEQKQIEEEYRRHNQRNQEEHFNAGRGWEQGAASVREEERSWRQSKCEQSEFRDNWESTVLGIPRQKKKRKEVTL